MINSKLMNKFLKKALNSLDGDWIIIGGTLLPMMGIDHRVTIDIDIINLDFKSSTNETIQLMEIAESLKLPIESINQAGAYFLSKIDNLKEHLVLLDKSKKCRIYRPDAYLYIRLKIARMSESDLSDCLIFIKNNIEEYLLMKADVLKIVKGQLKQANPEQQTRLAELLEFLNKTSK